MRRLLINKTNSRNSFKLAVEVISKFPENHVIRLLAEGRYPIQGSPKGNYIGVEGGRGGDGGHKKNEKQEGRRQKGSK